MLSRALKAGAWVAAITVAIIASITWVAAGKLISPPRRPLMAYHHEWLEHADEHGIRVSEFKALDGKVPCLYVEPDAIQGPGQRGLVLRGELAERGFNLDEYGVECGTLVLLHGRGGRKEDLLPVAERFAAAGFRCVLPDLPSHGESPLKKSNFGDSPFECELAGAVLREASAKYHFPAGPAGIWGMSMGGSFAISAADADARQWKAMVLVSTFDSLSGVVSDQLRKWTGPAAPFLTAFVDLGVVCQQGTPPMMVHPIDKARRIEVPTLMAHGDSDTLISLSRGRNLYDAFPGTDKKWITVKGAGHGNILVSQASLYAEMSAWYLQWMDPGLGKRRITVRRRNLSLTKGG